MVTTRRGTSTEPPSSPLYPTPLNAQKVAIRRRYRNGRVGGAASKGERPMEGIQEEAEEGLSPAAIPPPTPGPPAAFSPDPTFGAAPRSPRSLSPHPAPTPTAPRLASSASTRSSTHSTASLPRSFTRRRSRRSSAERCFDDIESDPEPSAFGNSSRDEEADSDDDDDAAEAVAGSKKSKLDLVLSRLSRLGPKEDDPYSRMPRSSRWAAREPDFEPDHTVWRHPPAPSPRPFAPAPAPAPTPVAIPAPAPVPVPVTPPPQPVAEADSPMAEAEAEAAPPSHAAVSASHSKKHLPSQAAKSSHLPRPRSSTSSHQVLSATVKPRATTPTTLVELRSWQRRLEARVKGHLVAVVEGCEGDGEGGEGGFEEMENVEGKGVFGFAHLRGITDLNPVRILDKVRRHNATLDLLPDRPSASGSVHTTPSAVGSSSSFGPSKTATVDSHTTVVDPPAPAGLQAPPAHLAATYGPLTFEHQRETGTSEAFDGFQDEALGDDESEESDSEVQASESVKGGEAGRVTSTRKEEKRDVPVGIPPGDFRPLNDPSTAAALNAGVERVGEGGVEGEGEGEGRGTRWAGFLGIEGAGKGKKRIGGAGADEVLGAMKERDGVEEAAANSLWYQRFHSQRSDLSARVEDEKNPSVVAYTIMKDQVKRHLGYDLSKLVDPSSTESRLALEGRSLVVDAGGKDPLKISRNQVASTLAVIDQLVRIMTADVRRSIGGEKREGATMEAAMQPFRPLTAGAVQTMKDAARANGVREGGPGFGGGGEIPGMVGLAKEVIGERSYHPPTDLWGGASLAGTHHGEGGPLHQAAAAAEADAEADAASTQAPARPHFSPAVVGGGAGAPQPAASNLAVPGRPLGRPAGVEDGEASHHWAQSMRVQGYRSTLESGSAISPSNPVI